MGMLINDGKNGKVICCRFTLENMLKLQRRLKIKFGNGFKFTGKYTGEAEIAKHYFHKGERGYMELMLFVDPQK